MKKRFVTILAIIMVVSLCFSAQAIITQATDEDMQTVVKTLIGEGAGSAAGGSEWAPVGNYSSYNQEAETIADASQADGGDMIFRSALDTTGKDLVQTNWGFSKHSESKEKACQQINGLTIKYYDNTCTQKYIIFNENYGQLHSGRFFGIRYNMQNAANGVANGQVQLGLWYQSDPNGTYTWDSNMSWGPWSNYDYHNDYDYFKDPVTVGYQNVGDNSATFVGTQNVLEFKLDNNDLCLFLNGKLMFNLVDAGVVSNVISECSDGMYISFYGEGGYGKNAMKVTDMYNVVSSWNAGVSELYSTTDATAVENKMSSTGAVQLRNASGKTSYDATYTQAQNIGDLTASFNFDGKDLAVNDCISMLLGDKITLKFKKVTDTTANMSVVIDGQDKGEEEVPFNFSGTLNTINVKELKDYAIYVNGTKYSKNINDIYNVTSNLTDGKLNVGFKVEATADSMLTPILYKSNEVKALESVEGQTVTGSNTVIKADGNYYVVYNTQDGEFTVKNDVKKVIADSFNIKYRYGATNATADNFRIVIGDNNRLIFNFKNNGEKTVLSVLTKKGDANEELVYSEEIRYDWNYGDKQLRFVNDKGYSYIVMDKDNELIAIDKATDEASYGKIAEIINLIPQKMAEISFEMQEGQNMVAFCGTEYYVETSIKAGWSAGAYGKPIFGYDDEVSTTLVFNGNSMKKDKEVIIDGFTMKFRTFYDDSNNYNSPAVVLASTNSWFSLDTLGAFMFSVEKKNSSTVFAVRYSLGETVYGYISNFVVTNWNWNNNIDNEIKLEKTNGVWSWTVNGEVLTPDANHNEYSAIYDSVYESFSENKGFMQFDSGTGYIWKITSLNEYVFNVAPVAKKITLEDSYTTGKTITLDMTKAFLDANNDVLTYSVISGEGEISGTNYVFTPNKAGEYIVEIKANDGKGGEATQTLTFKIEDAKSSGGCNSSFNGNALMLLCMLAGAALIVVNRKVKAL